MEELFENSWALIIAVGKIKQSSAPLDRLTNPKNDAKSIEDMLTKDCNFPASNIFSLYEDKATFSSIDNIIENTLSKKISKNDRFLLFFSGHALTRPKRGHQNEEEGYIVFYDSVWLSQKKPNWTTLKSMNILIKQINDNIPANQILFLLDCCFSGIAHKPLGYDSEDDEKPSGMISAAKNKVSSQIITASNKDEPVIDSGKVPQHSIFTQTILDFICNEKAYDYPEGFISAKKMGKKIQPLVVSESFMWGKGRRQEPQFYRSDFDKLGEFVIKQFSDTEIEEQKKKKEKFIITETDEFIKNANLLSFLNSNCIVNQINKDLENEPELQFTASSFLVLIKQKLKENGEVNEKINEYSKNHKLTDEQRGKFWHELAVNILISGVKIPIVSPLIPDDVIMANKNKEQVKENI